jgi:hypothetical protein
MKRLETSTSIHRIWFAAVIVLAGVIASGSVAWAQAQSSTDRAIDQAQRAVRDQIASQTGGRDLTVEFDRDARTEFPSNTQVRVRGTGSVTRRTDTRLRSFSYEALVNTRSSNVSAIRHDWSGDWYNNGNGSGFGRGRGRNGGPSAVANRLTGTYRLNAARSDNAATTARNVTRTLPVGQQERLLREVTRRLEAPDSLSIERNGRTVTIASSTATRVTFEADGLEQIEQSRNNRQMRTNATLTGDRLVVSTDGDRAVDYQVTFEPLDNGRSLVVTRRITHEDLRQPVVGRSVYDKTSDTPQWDLYDRIRRNGRGAGSAANRSIQGSEEGGFIVPDGTDVVAVLNDALSTRNASEGTRFALTVRTPAQYAGAVIDGTLARSARSASACETAAHTSSPATSRASRRPTATRCVSIPKAWFRMRPARLAAP